MLGPKLLCYGGMKEIGNKQTLKGEKETPPEGRQTNDAIVGAVVVPI